MREAGWRTALDLGVSAGPPGLPAELQDLLLRGAQALVPDAHVMAEVLLHLLGRVLQGEALPGARVEQLVRELGDVLQGAEAVLELRGGGGVGEAASSARRQHVH